MIIITKEQWNSIANDYKGEFSDFQGTNPDWKGKKTVLEGCVIQEASTRLLIEDVHFIIK